MIKVVKTVADMKQAIKSGVCYISGPISGMENYKEIFAEAENLLFAAGMIAINPAYMPEGLPYDDYFPTCYAQIGISNALCFLPDYAKSTGAAREAKRAQWNKKEYWMFTLEQYVLFEEYSNLRQNETMISKTNKQERKRVADWIKTVRNSIRVSGALLAEWIRKVNPPKTEIQLQNDEVKRVLQSYQYCLHQIDAACDEIEKLDTRRKRITVQYREVHGGGGSDYTEAVIENIKKLDRDIVAKTKKLESERRVVEIWIDSLKDYQERQVLSLRYINGMKFEAIAEKLNYNQDHVKRLHGWGINKLRELFADKIAKK
ncbi:MAG: DUF4406 domain-containing protein [Acidaminococcaceae bacterium]|nr:DUF4406 domain-containing protein [Acidaminococcaceae bacterium]